MKLKYIYAVAMAVVFTVQASAQSKVYLDSATVARIISGKDIAPPTQPTTAESGQIDNTSEDAGEDNETTERFQTDNSLSWEQNIKARLDRILQSDITQTTSVGVMVWDLTDDKSLYNYRERTQMRPASTMKCVTAIAALDCLGADYNFKTSIYYTGTLNDSTQTLDGDIYCVGGMDPMLNNTDVTAIAEAIKDLGIQNINGSIYADLSFKDKNEFGKGWCWDDKNPPLRPLQIGKRDVFLSTLKSKLRECGISHNGIMGEKVLPQGVTLITERTHPIAQVMYKMMKESNNLYAESMFYQVAASARGKWNSARKGEMVINKLIQKLGLQPRNYNIADGSGLSLYNYVSPELEIQLLRYAYKQPNIYPTLLNTLPIAGVDGTLRKRMRGTAAAGNVRAKTGTVMGVSSLAGYLTASNRHTLCFAIIVNGGMSQAPMRGLQNRICVALCQ